MPNPNLEVVKGAAAAGGLATLGTTALCSAGILCLSATPVGWIVAISALMGGIAADEGR